MTSLIVVNPFFDERNLVSENEKTKTGTVIPVAPYRIGGTGPMNVIHCNISIVDSMLHIWFCLFYFFGALFVNAIIQ
jgi:hypothetical protein